MVAHNNMKKKRARQQGGGDGGLKFAAGVRQLRESACKTTRIYRRYELKTLEKTQQSYTFISLSRMACAVAQRLLCTIRVCSLIFGLLGNEAPR